MKEHLDYCLEETNGVLDLKPIDKEFLLGFFEVAWCVPNTVDIEDELFTLQKLGFTQSIEKIPYLEVWRNDQGIRLIYWYILDEYYIRVWLSGAREVFEFAKMYKAALIQRDV